MSLTISGLCKTYDNVDSAAPPALNDINIDTPPGSFLTLLGPSGCGKSTLLNMISGLDRPSAGRIEIDGRVVYDSAATHFLQPAERNISMVFQSYAIWPHMTVAENIDFPLKHGNRRKTLTSADRARTVADALEKVHLTKFRDRPAPMLSGGQQQRVSLARALAQKPSIILLDEPLSNLDASLRERMQKEIRSIVTAEKITAVYVTHDQKEALSMSDKIVVLREGVVEQIGTPREIYYTPRNRFVAQFMGSPNLIEGTVAGQDAERATILVDCALGRIAAAYRAEVPVSMGDKVCLVLKQEDLQLVTAGTASIADNVFTLPLAQQVFMGDRIEMLLRLGDRSLSVYASARRPASGHEVQFRCAPEEIHYFSAT